MSAKTVLVVASDPADRSLYGEWLEEEDLEVLSCPGPSRPDYTCIGARTGTCALAKGADVVVLDASLPGDDLGQGASASDLISLYASLGKPVVALATSSRQALPPARWLRWPPTRDELVTAVRRDI